MRTERRSETRLLCSELVMIAWDNPEGVQGTTVGLLEDISTSGARFQAEDAVPPGSHVQVSYPGGKWEGTVRHTRALGDGYLLGVEFAAGAQWLAAQYEPGYLLNPDRLSTDDEDTADLPQGLGRERRRKDRFAFDIRVNLAVPGRRERVPGRTENLSEGGMGLICPEPVAVGTDVLVEDAAGTFVAEVRFCQEVSDGYRVGLLLRGRMMNA